MLYLLWVLIRNTLTVPVSNGMAGFTQSIGVIIILCVGMMILLSAVGLKVSANLGSTVTKGIFKALGFLAKYLFKFFAWIGKGISWILKKVYSGVESSLAKKLPKWASTLIATAITLIVLIIII